MSSITAPAIATSDAPSVGLDRPSLGGAVARFFVVLVVLLAFGLRRLFSFGSLSGPVALRLAFERLGPTYVKLGQLVASGEALFPRRYSEEFRSLLDRVPPFSLAEVERTIAEELGLPPERIFAALEPTPVAAASIAQVHCATLTDATSVVVKVQRPGIGALASRDVAILRFVARLASRLSVHARRANLVGIVEDFEANLVLELDFRKEASRMREFNEVMGEMGNASVAAPRVYEKLSGRRVLTMERFFGNRIDDTVAVRASGFDPEERLLVGIRSWFQTLIRRSFFHGDVHAGNFMLLTDGRVGFLDFGIVGEIGPTQRQGVLTYVLGFQQRDFGRVADAMIAMETTDGRRPVDRDGLARDLRELFGPLLDPKEGFRLTELVPGMMRTSRAHGLRMPRELVLVTKQLVYLDRYAKAYGGPKMNVLTDQRLTGMILEDLMKLPQPNAG